MVTNPEQTLSGHCAAAPPDARLLASPQPTSWPSTLHCEPPQPGINCATIESIRDWLIPPSVGSPTAPEENGSLSPTSTPAGSRCVAFTALPEESVSLPSPVAGFRCSHVSEGEPLSAPVCSASTSPPAQA